MGNMIYNPDIDKFNCTHIFTATNGGTTFSGNLATTSNIKLFQDNAQVNDCVYFGTNVSTLSSFSNIYLDISSAMVGENIELVWEYYTPSLPVAIREFQETPADWTTAKWRPLQDLQDDTNGLTEIGENVVKFPIQMHPTRVNINGANNSWIRCRIANMTSITTGAEVNSVVQLNRGRLYINDYTNEEPCTFTEVYTWLKDNEPHITSIKGGTGFFDFKKVLLQIDSKLVSYRETIEIGNWFVVGGNVSGRHRFDFLETGIKLSEEAGVDGSTFIIHGKINDTPVSFSNDTKCYGARFTSRGGIDAAAGYIRAQGEFINCSLEYNASVDIDLISTNNTWVNYGTYILSQFWGIEKFKNNTFILITNRIGLLYSAGWDVRDFYWNIREDEAGALFTKNQTATGPQTYNFYDCTPLPPLGSPSQGNPTLMLFSGSTIREMDFAGQVFHYNSQTDVFTDYLQAIKTGGSGNVPIHGEVDDCIYWYDVNSTFTQGYEMIFDIPEGQENNDYEYAHEVYVNGQWRKYGDFIDTEVLDKTNGFKNSGHILLLNTPVSNKMVVVNSINAPWKRIRITKKGTGTPVITTMRTYRGCSWANDWEFKEWFSINYKVIEQDNTPIENAKVTIRDKHDKLVFENYTDEHGNTSGDFINTKHYYFDRDADLSVSPTYTGRGKLEIYSPFKIKISKDGYETYFVEKNIFEKQNETQALKKAIPTMIGTKGEVVIKADPKNIKNRNICITT